MGRHTWIVAVLGGLAAALGHAPFHLWYVALAGLIALFWAVGQAASGGQAFRRAWFGGAAYFAVSLHWIVEPFLVDAAIHGWMAPGALILMAGGLALFWAVAGWAAQRLAGPASMTALAFAVTLTLAEFARGHLFTGFPWAMPGYIWAETPVLATAAFTGSYGLTFVTLLCASLGAAARHSLASGLGAALLVALLFGAGALRLSDTTATPELGRVALVHPNIPQNEKWNREKVPGHIDHLLDLTRSAVANIAPPDLIVWPEVAVVYPLDVAGPVLEAASAAAGNTPIITGINRRDGENWYNTITEIGEGGAIGTVYDKVHLVPFGEYIPFKLGFLRAMAATTSNGFSSGEAVRLIETPIGRALPLICYEGIFPAHIFKVDARADYLLLVTNDAWFGTFAGPYQHLDQARFRAAEQGLPVVRVANAGVSTVIDRFGRFESRLDLGEAGSRNFVVRAGQPTLYARTGDLPALALLILLSIGLLWSKGRNAIANSSASS
ncbi:MAG: apolipoprotein N-acyltransferase [Pseudomonadota bacterium]